jgi:UDP-glucuronate 4-epimerase
MQCEVNIQDKEALDEPSPNNTDVIEHLAAKAGVRLSIQDSIAYQKVNVAGSQNMLEVARLNENKKFIFASSRSVYGKNPNIPWEQDNLVLQLISHYVSTKVIGEYLGHVYSHFYDIHSS